MEDDFKCLGNHSKSLRCLEPQWDKLGGEISRLSVLRLQQIAAGHAWFDHRTITGGRNEIRE